MKRAHKLVSIACGLGALCIVGIWSLTLSPIQTAPPGDISVAPPSPTVAQDVAAFSGVWLGAWGGELPTTLVVEQISSDGAAQVIYSWGDSPIHKFKAGWSRLTGQISNSTLQLISEDGAKIDFTLEPSGLLKGRYELTKRPPSFAELHRMRTTNLPAILEAAKKPVGDWKEIRIPVQSQVGPAKGRNLGLQTTIYHQASGGRHPVVIFNHGSTGPGVVPANFVFRGGNEEMVFHSLGYVVVIPMRKGRGLSDGPNLEEDNSFAPSVQLDSAIEDLQAVVKYVSHQDDVNPRKIVVAGVSRGGLLSAAYAGRYPADVAGVINFSGGWFSEDMPAANFNFETFSKSGHDAKVPMLWLYADHDSFYSLRFVKSEFSRFRDAGGRGELIEVQDIPGEGHLLSLWVDRWRDKVTSYLNGL